MGRIRVSGDAGIMPYPPIYQSCLSFPLFNPFFPGRGRALGGETSLCTAI